jgi:hypothetical protein
MNVVDEVYVCISLGGVKKWQMIILVIEQAPNHGMNNSEALMS